MPRTPLPTGLHIILCSSGKCVSPQRTTEDSGWRAVRNLPGYADTFAELLPLALLHEAPLLGKSGDVLGHVIEVQAGGEVEEEDHHEGGHEVHQHLGLRV